MIGWQAVLGWSICYERDGIMRGSSTLINLGQENSNDAVIRAKAAQHYSFSKGSSKADYPSSHIGAIALIRQTLYDANWYSKLVEPKPEANLSLEAINGTTKVPPHC